MIDPCIPENMKGYRIKRVFRNTEFDITVNNPEGLQSGNVELYLDGEKIEGNILTVFDGQKHCVTATLR